MGGEGTIRGGRVTISPPPPCRAGAELLVLISQDSCRIAGDYVVIRGHLLLNILYIGYRAFALIARNQNESAIAQ